MKKLKKYIYPFIFSMCFFLIFIILSTVLEIVFPSGDFGGLAYAFIALHIWILVIMPIFCLKYCKLIHQEKHKFLFAFYGPLVIALCHTGPFFRPAVTSSDVDIIIWIAVALFIWMACWTFIRLHIYVEAAKEDAEETANKLNQTKE